MDAIVKSLIISSFLSSALSLGNDDIKCILDGLIKGDIDDVAPLNTIAANDSNPGEVKAFRKPKQDTKLNEVKSIEEDYKKLDGQFVYVFEEKTGGFKRGRVVNIDEDKKQITLFNLGDKEKQNFTVDKLKRNHTLVIDDTMPVNVEALDKFFTWSVKRLQKVIKLQKEATKPITAKFFKDLEGELPENPGKMTDKVTNLEETQAYKNALIEFEKKIKLLTDGERFELKKMTAELKSEYPSYFNDHRVYGWFHSIANSPILENAQMFDYVVDKFKKEVETMQLVENRIHAIEMDRRREYEWFKKEFGPSKKEKAFIFSMMGVALTGVGGTLYKAIATTEPEQSDIEQAPEDPLKKSDNQF